MRRIFLLVIALNCFNAWSAEKGTSDDIINFADANVKAVCVQYWDTNGDGELSMSEAAAVTTLNRRFYYGEREIITSFDELRFFTNLKVINSGEFENCQNLVSIVLPESISEILAKAFYGCSSLETIQFKEGITKISDQAFYGCKNLKSLSFPKSLNSLGDEAFRGCTGIESVIVPHTLTMSESGSLRAIFPFKGCTGIKNIEIHSPVFGSWFNGLENINKIYVGCEVEKYSAFLAGGVEIIEVDSENKVFDSRNNCNAIIKTATNELVGGCKSTVIPKSVTSISSNAFSNCTNLVAIEIPAGVTSIGSSAFSGCTGLQNVISHIKAPFVTNGFASNTLASATLTIPFGCTNLYKETAGWEFQTIKEMEGTKEDTTYIQFADSLTKKACIKNWDISGDGEISLYEAGLVTSVDFEGSNTITSFDEFKYFTRV